MNKKASEDFFLTGEVPKITIPSAKSKRDSNKSKRLPKYKKLNGEDSISKQDPNADRTVQTRTGAKTKVAGFSEFYISSKKYLPNDWKDKFLYQYSTTGSIRLACEYADVSRQYLNDYKKEHPDFAQMMTYAKEDYNDRIEQEIVRRGKEGIYEPLSHQGYLTGHYIKRYSDQLLLAKAKAEMPKYRDSGGAVVNVNIAENQVVLGFDESDNMFQPD